MTDDKYRKITLFIINETDRFIETENLPDGNGASDENHQ